MPIKSPVMPQFNFAESEFQSETRFLFLVWIDTATYRRDARQ